MNYLAEISKKSGAQVIHSHFGNVGWANLGAIRKLNVKHVVTFYGMDVNKLPIEHPVWQGRYRRLFAEVDLILCEGTHMARCLMELGCPEHKVKVQHLGVDVDNILFKPRRWHADQPLRVMIAASFREKKGIPHAIEALQIVASEVPVLLTIIGDASQDSESQQEKVRILAALERSGLKEHMAVDPSRIDLLFERFISAARDEPPDIDVDFEHERREGRGSRSGGLRRGTPGI